MRRFAGACLIIIGAGMFLFGLYVESDNINKSIEINSRMVTSITDTITTLTYLAIQNRRDINSMMPDVDLSRYKLTPEMVFE